MINKVDKIFLEKTKQSPINVPLEIMEIFDYQGNLISQTEIKRSDLLYKNQYPHVICDNCEDCNIDK